MVPNQTVIIAVDEVHNTLNSMALLSAINSMPALPHFIQRAAASLSPAQRRTNQLLFEALNGALDMPNMPADFLAYLDALQAQEPKYMAVRAARQLGQPRLLDSMPPAAALIREAHALVEQPTELQRMIVEHLCALWDSTFAAEWQRAERELQNQVRVLTQGMPQNEGATPDLVLRGLQALVAREAMPLGVERMVFVPTPHVGRYVTRSLHDGTLRLFFHATRFFGALFRTTPVSMPELLGRINQLNDETRLNILKMFATRDKLTAQEVMDELGLTQSTTSRALNQLSVFVQAGRSGDSKKTYTLMPAQIDFTLDAVKQLLAAPDIRVAPPEESTGDYPPELRRFLDSRERVTNWPSKQKDRLMVLDYLASKFEPNTEYTEREVNAIITRYHAYGDHATLRRELYDYGYLHRARDGSRYWRAEEPLPDELKRQQWPHSVMTGRSASSDDRQPTTDQEE